MQTIDKINKTLLNAGKNISGLAILSMMIAVVLDVFVRNIFNFSLPGVYIFVESFLMPIVVFPALGYTYMIGILPRLTDFIARGPKWFQNLNNIIIHIMDITVFTLLVYYTFLYAMSGFHSQMAIPIAGTLVPVWPIHFIVPVGYFLVLLELLIKAIRRKEFYLS